MATDIAADIAKKPHDENDDDSENDDDYVPEEDMDADDDDEQQGAPTQTDMTPRLSSTKRKAVDDAFEKLFGYPWGTRFVPKRARITTNRGANHREDILSDIFGSTVAAHLLATSSTVLGHEKQRVLLPTRVEQTVTEVKRFAGRNVVMTKTVTVDASQNGDGVKPSTNRQKPAGLDSVLVELAGPSKISTVAKTSADWDLYKTKTGVDEELEKQAQSNKAFLVKKDFLDRVDTRRFEQEKAQRDRQRASKK